MNLHDIPMANLAKILEAKLQERLGPQWRARYYPNEISDYQFSYTDGLRWHNWNKQDINTYLPRERWL